MVLLSCFEFTGHSRFWQFFARCALGEYPRFFQCFVCFAFLEPLSCFLCGLNLREISVFFQLFAIFHVFVNSSLEIRFHFCKVLAYGCFSEIWYYYRVLNLGGISVFGNFLHDALSGEILLFEKFCVFCVLRPIIMFFVWFSTGRVESFFNFLKHFERFGLFGRISLLFESFLESFFAIFST